MRLGIIGTNFISDRLVEAADLVDGVTVTSVFSRKRDTGEAFAAKHPTVNRIFCSLDELLSSDAIDAVYVASPIVAHAEQTCAALRAGKHVLCEKMMAHTYPAFLAMKDAAKETGRVLLEAMRPAHDPAYGTLRALIPRIGQIVGATLEFRQYSSRYDRFKAGVLTNAFDPSMYNSSLSDIGIYPLQAALMLFGNPLRLLSASSKILHNGFEGEGELVLDYGSFSTSVIYSKIRNSEGPSVIFGDLGSITVDKISQPTLVTLTTASGGSEAFSFSPPTDNNMVYELEAFRDMCEGVLDPSPYLKMTEVAQRIVDSAYRLSGAAKHLPALDASR